MNNTNLNPRPTFMLTPNPMLAWNEVPEAKSYKLKMTNQTTGKVIWKIELTSTSDGVEQDNGILKCDYPAGESPLDRNGTYLLSGETHGGKNSSRKGQVQVILLEDTTIKAVEKFESLLDFNNQPLGELEKKWLQAKEAILVFDSDSFSSAFPWRDCLVLSLT